MGIVISLIVLVFSAILHEVAHGYVADRLGDPTARLLGRLTLDPRRHIDPFLSILLPLLLLVSGSPIIFGGAKPVPIDEFNLKDGRKDVALVSLAGPLTNVLLAVVATALFRLAQISPLQSQEIVIILLITFVKINVLLAIFNLLPIPPLDGSKIFSLVLPNDAAKAYLSLGTMGMFLIFFLLAFPLGSFSLQQMLGSLYTFVLSLLGF